MTDTPPPLSVESGDWRQMADAPRDGTPIIARYCPWNVKTNEPCEHVVWWFDSEWRSYPRTDDVAYADAWRPMPLSTSTPTVQSTEGLREEAADSFDYLSIFRAARQRYVDDATDSSFDEHLTRYAYEAGMSAALSASSPVQSGDGNAEDVARAIARSKGREPAWKSYLAAARMYLSVRKALSALSSVDAPPTERAEDLPMCGCDFRATGKWAWCLVYGSRCKGRDHNLTPTGSEQL